MPMDNPANWNTLANKPTTVAGLGLSNFDASAIAAQAGAAVGAVGTYALLRDASTTNTRTPGSTAAGSGLRYVSVGGMVSSAPSGTWRIMGYQFIDSGAGQEFISVWLRIS